MKRNEILSLLSPRMRQVTEALLVLEDMDYEIKQVFKQAEKEVTKIWKTKTSV